MTKAKILLILGIWVAILPYLGFPNFIKNLLFLITGLSIIYVSIVIYNQNKHNKKKDFENFSENEENQNIKNILDEELKRAEEEALDTIKKLQE